MWLIFMKEISENHKNHQVNGRYLKTTILFMMNYTPARMCINGGAIKTIIPKGVTK